MSVFSVRRADWNRDRRAIRLVRDRVFVIEQRVDPGLEWDDVDATCLHVLAETHAGEPVGTGRLECPAGKIGRMAVLSEHRGQGAGGAILDALVAEARSAGLREVYLHAQTHALSFYDAHGFVAEGELFDEADIPHRLMRRQLDRE